ncbi:hypothetical protein D915_000521 [Fasciola hepatica]|uniref:CUE domain-containing protein n=1 Tax=Fasciola hepatica TaxID=6192 RepID=A0A4E0RK03_FASHE|nr:hypothetical protein D915_000521 [Fasciola hepatica]
MTEVTPLELRETYDSRSKSLLPALSPQRVRELVFVHFKPPTDSSDELLALFSEQIKMICSDLDELLNFDFEQFWCQMLYNKSLHSCLRSVLSWAPRGLQTDLFPESCRMDYRSLLTLVLSVFSKASTPLESETEFISKNKFGELIYEHYVFDMPLVMDICAIYFHLATHDVISIMNNIFTYQELYFEDLKKTLLVLNEMFDRLEREISAPDRLKSFDRLQDLTFYVGDICWSLFTFFNILSQLELSTPSDLCFAGAMHEKLPSLYEHSVVPLRKAIQSDLQLTSGQRQTLYSQLSKASVWLVTTVRSAFCEPHLLDRIRRSASESTSSNQSAEPGKFAQNYLDFMIQLLNYRSFSLVYQLLYPFEQDLVVIRRSVGYGCLDDAAVQYLLGAIDSLFTEAGVLHRPPITDISRIHSVERSAEETPQPGPSISGPVREVKEILPDMDVELIQRCLDAFDQDSARVINAALEGSIPEHVLNPDESQSFSGGFKEELDTLHAANHLRIPQLKANQVWQGKKDLGTSVPELGKQLKKVTICSAVSVWEDVEDDERAVCSHPEDLVNSRPVNTLDPYEDEYDDSYEVHEGVVDDVGSSAESDSQQPSNQEPCPSETHQQQHQRQQQQQQQQQRWNKHTNQPWTHNQNRPNTFRKPCLPIENPEVVRERQQVQRAYRRGRFLQSSYPGMSVPPPQPSATTNSHADFPSDVTISSQGRTTESALEPKTTGSSHSKPSDRVYKNVHKARFANHNRRRLADKKRQL